MYKNTNPYFKGFQDFLIVICLTILHNVDIKYITIHITMLKI
jgi:hypothetical protein